MSARGLVLSLFLLVGGCVTAGHDPGAQAVASADCYTCHKTDFQTATAPVHNTTDNPPNDCVSCHSTQSWIPGGRHPENKFPIQSGPHSGIDCANCHDPSLGSSVAGANVTCIVCHTQARTADAHSDVGSYHFDPSRPAFCRDCHPTGRNE